MLFPTFRQIAHALLTRPPLTRREQALSSSVRLACVRHAASVRPEPGSNSLSKFTTYPKISKQNLYQSHLSWLQILKIIAMSINSPITSLQLKTVNYQLSTAITRYWLSETPFVPNNVSYIVTLFNLQGTLPCAASYGFSAIFSAKTPFFASSSPEGETWYNTATNPCQYLFCTLFEVFSQGWKMRGSTL